jgi:hypothetical protein
MNTVAPSVAPIIAAVVARARRRIVAHFYVHHAISAEEAVPYVPAKGVVHRQFDEMLAKGILHEAAPGRFWIDQAAYKADLERRRRMVIPLIVVVLLILAAIPLFFYQNKEERGFMSQTSAAPSSER